MSKNVYEIVTNKILEKLEKGVIPWQKSWCNVGKSYNIVTKKHYSIINQLSLDQAGAYGTFKQWTDLGGKIKKGAKSSIIVFWKMHEKKDEVDENGEPILLPVLKYFNVFHQSQVENIEIGPPIELPSKESERIEEAEQVKNSYIEKDGINLIETLSNRAFYRPSTHSINMPAIEQFSDVKEYYSVFFHEAVHSTSKHLKRELGASFGSEKYSKEELIAEMGSAIIMSELGLETDNTLDNSAAYIQSWIKHLREDNKLIVQACSKAEKAVKYILDNTEVAEEEEIITEENIV